MEGIFLLLRLFNSILFVIANVSLAVYTLQRFFRTMNHHYKLVSSGEEFNNLVNQSRASLKYVGDKVAEAMKEMEKDIEREVCITDNLTKLAPKIASLSRRFTELEEGIIELARQEYNMENATVETPSDINEEVLRVIRTAKQNHQMPSPPASIQQRNRAAVASETTTPMIERPASKAQRRPFSPISKLPISPRAAGRPLSPGVVPEVSLLTEQNYAPAPKPIGFRPPWMCQV